MTMLASKRNIFCLLTAALAATLSACTTASSTGSASAPPSTSSVQAGAAPSSAPYQPAPLPVKKNIGYTNTPIIAGTSWHVHDGERPVPRVVTPGASFSHGAPPPADAVILFDGTDLSKWMVEGGGPAKWKLENGYMEVAPKSGSIRTRDTFADFQLHLEFATPAKVDGNSQGRGNSGILFNGVYEVQVLDSFQNPTYPDGQCGALYGQIPPLANASKPPGQWQSYDIIFESPRWDASKQLTKKANVTVIHNGVVLHHKREYTGTTPHQNNGNYDNVHAPEMFIELQDHNNPMRFRNIWLRRIGEYDKP
jgi:3-keto-disaccharide hydrolase